MAKNRRPRPKNRKQTAGLIVEGDTEYYALPRLAALVPGCPPIKAVNLRGVGSDVTPTAIAQHVVGKIKEHIAAERAPIVVCIDREQRCTCPGQLAIDIRLALTKILTGEQMSSVYVVVADRTFETWLLAGAQRLFDLKIFKQLPTKICFEGELGERGLKGTVELSKALGRSYKKTEDGPTLFEMLDFPVARKHGKGLRGSRSLDKLLRTLGV